MLLNAIVNEISLFLVTVPPPPINTRQRQAIFWFYPCIVANVFFLGGYLWAKAHLEYHAEQFHHVVIIFPRFFSFKSPENSHFSSKRKKYDFLYRKRHNLIRFRRIRFLAQTCKLARCQPGPVGGGLAGKFMIPVSYWFLMVQRKDCFRQDDEGCINISIFGAFSPCKLRK